ncbi:wall-associated receptor kinase-like 14 [Henckelia pumila]|uniref:wall-associated receptor kinase-like 14 n=1 Tax=Henckelia pumila TaxID=405737 RepID=UPI003C6DFB0E
MKIRLINLVQLLGFVLSIVQCILASCNQTCGVQKLHFPFGFSAGCKIQLSCSSNGTVHLAGGFPVQSVTSDTILLTVPAICGRPVEAVRSLFTPNYAPTSHNAILLQNCSGQRTSCFIPTTMVQTHFELLDCNAKNDTISCYSEEENRSSFINYDKLRGIGCRSMFSAISMESFGNSSSVSLDVQIVRLEWWILGGCRCAENARCVRVESTPVEGNPPGYRCQCAEGFAGDGFIDGLGCWKESLGCNPSKYMNGRCGGTTRIGVLVGGVAAGASLMTGFGLIFCFIRKRSKLRSRSRKSRRLCKGAGITIPVHPYKEIEKAADSFSNKRRLGTGAYGTVYSGKLNDEWVAIKRIKQRDADGIEQVINEIKLLSSVSHPNLVRLLGCSIEHEEQILVYEFMPNGTLSQHLQREKGNGLPWPVRLTIASETAQAISYLHNAMHPPIYHRDIKSSNILLDYNYKSKVADFGLSRLGMIESSHISTAPQGTPGYLDPQYHQDFHLSDKSDVYSLGVVLIEIITSLRAVDFSRPQNEVNLASLAVDRIGRGCLSEIIDPSLELNFDPWTVSSVHKVAELAFRCLAFHRDMRPSMMEVAIELEQIRLSRWSNSDETSSCSSSSNLSEKPLKQMVLKEVLSCSGPFSGTNSSDTVADFSPFSVEDSWQSDQSSPSSNSLLNHFKS